MGLSPCHFPERGGNLGGRENRPAGQPRTRGRRGVACVGGRLSVICDPIFGVLEMCSWDLAWGDFEAVSTSVLPLRGVTGASSRRKRLRLRPPTALGRSCPTSNSRGTGERGPSPRPPASTVVWRVTTLSAWPCPRAPVLQCPCAPARHFYHVYHTAEEGLDPPPAAPLGAGAPGRPLGPTLQSPIGWVRKGCGGACPLHPYHKEIGTYPPQAHLQPRRRGGHPG